MPRKLDGAVLEAHGYVNGDDCFLAWSLEYEADCLGFEIARDVTHGDGSHQAFVLSNYAGFVHANPKPYEEQPSTVWPFQRYTWTDHGVGEGDSVSYAITPMRGTPGSLVADTANAATVGPLVVTATAATEGAQAATPPRTEAAYFNRGVLISQFIAKALGEPITDAAIRKFVNSLALDETTLRTFLMGPLGDRLFQILDDVASDPDSEIYTALYELNDPDLIARLLTLGQRAHVVLSNGSNKKVNSDGNKKANKALNGHIDLHRRMLWSEGLGHNKFLVVVHKKAAVAVWTGSTNWATTALCTQMNNAIYIADPDLASTYLAQWTLLRDDEHTNPAGKIRHFGPALIASNDLPKASGDPVLGPRITWFTRTSHAQEMDAVADIINGAQHAVLFLMFEPGSAGLLSVIQARLSPASAAYDPSLYVHGVVNTLSADSSTVSVTTVGQGKATPFNLDVVQPQGADSGLAGWADEISRAEFLMSAKDAAGHSGVIGYAIIHSKVIVIDPFTDPVVVTGSHNFSHSASSANDENLLIIRGNRALAERYAVNVMSTYQHYRWRAYLLECQQNGISPWQNLAGDATWQKKHAEHDRELTFWLQRP